VPKPGKNIQNRHAFKDVDKLCEHLISMWCELDQSVVNHAIDDWRRRLSACVDAEGRHFEHYL